MRKSSAIKKSINTLARNTKSLRDKYHVILCEIAGHAYQNSDPRMFDDILRRGVRYEPQANGQVDNR